MCGICCIILFQKNPDNIEFSADCKIFDNLKSRGPDSSDSTSVILSTDINCFFYGNVLHHQGAAIRRQPFKDSVGNILLWNGEIFNYFAEKQEFSQSDTKFLAFSLSRCNTESDITKVLSEIKGPWSIIYWHVKTRKVWISRDHLGRRSLLWGFSSPNHLSTVCISSVAASNCLCEFHSKFQRFDEIPANGIYCISLDEIKEKLTIDWYPWTNSCQDTSPDWPEDFKSININRHCGVSSPVKSSLNLELPVNDIYTNAGAIDPLRELKMFLGNEPYSLAVNRFAEIFGKSVELRASNQQFLCKHCFNDAKDNCEHAGVAVLFSGGIDSAVIAAFLHRYIDLRCPIDLINVAFAQKERTDESFNKLKKHSKSNRRLINDAENRFKVPDRISGLDALAELRSIFPRRKWNFVQVDVTKDELQHCRDKYITDLVYPLNTVLDDSIGCAVWFAARGAGYITSDDGDSEPYVSPARVVLVGMGADEQLAGYSRHRQKFKTDSWKGLLDEIQLEIGRISSRNLGRDDRVISAHGRECRFPFLDEDLMEFLNRLPIWLKANLTFPRGIGEKLILRLVAYRLGFRNVAVLAKRAIQFGSRIAKLENSKERASDVCQRLNFNDDKFG